MAEIKGQSSITSTHGMGAAAGDSMIAMSDSPLFTIRRRDLYRLADAWELDYPRDAPATEMRELFIARGIDVRHTPPREVRDRPKYDIEAMKITPEMSAEPGVPLGPPLHDWPALKRYCRTLGIKILNTDKKPDVLRKLEEHGQDAA